MSYVVIQDWMVDDLGLKGSRLIAYATIYGFTQGEQGVFVGSVGYLAEWAGVTRRAMQKTLRSLEDDGLVERSEVVANNCVIPTYTAVRAAEAREQSSQGGEASSREESSPGCEESSQGGELSSREGANKSAERGEKSSPNNIGIKIEDKLEDKGERAKHGHGRFGNVMLTDSELARLRDRLPNADSLIDDLSFYIESKGVRYKSHYATILSWGRRDERRARGAAASGAADPFWGAA